ncbi:hypothetical protein CCMSSC00406_0007223 [Pleurotus cornucopiae]|uniref:Uncharacterized protein n=1 Tax=Pleurotus cornucopiae TaxID=5321 RepID=A0ACB7IV47_PLECO|nr:hypothetical protein CCMSSC00406_0007223 [Pleurotus cornucopiae]
MDAESRLVENNGSTARDFCMLERNILSHLKLALLLSLLSSSMLLHARLVPDPTEEGPDQMEDSSKAIGIGSVHLAAAIAVIGAGCWEFHSGIRDLRDMRAFLVATKPHLAVMSVIAAIVFTTCVILLVDENE